MVTNTKQAKSQKDLPNSKETKNKSPSKKNSTTQEKIKKAFLIKKKKSETKILVGILAGERIKEIAQTEEGAIYLRQINHPVVRSLLLKKGYDPTNLVRGMKVVKYWSEKWFENNPPF